MTTLSNLFTALGAAYRHEVIEPITHLCPERLCERRRGAGVRSGSDPLLDASMVYLHIVLPWDLRALLPPLTQDWKNFVQGRALADAMDQRARRGSA